MCACVCVDEHAALAPRSALDAHRLVEHAQLLELAVADRDGCLRGWCSVRVCVCAGVCTRA